VKNHTPHYLLAEAARRCRTGIHTPVFLDAPLTDAQIGAAIRLAELGSIEFSDSVAQQLSFGRQWIAADFAEQTVARKIAMDRIDSEQELNATAGVWLVEPANARARVCIGYWLISVFVRALDKQETMELTHFLAQSKLRVSPKLEHPTVRRYPTGGISEKQALLLPAFIRYVSRKLGWYSTFLVARRLAHTGGTKDKLAILPGMKLVSASELDIWDGKTLPVRYFSADHDYCPRDSLLYRFRGETGTVADMGLMVSSIMSKQIAIPADVIVLDILFGSIAFLPTRHDAEDFANWCTFVGASFSLNLIVHFRQCDDMLGRTVGNSVEVWEAVELLKNARQIVEGPFDEELELALVFMRLFAQRLGEDESSVANFCIDGLKSGRVLDALFELWGEHGVSPCFIKKVKLDSHSTLLGGLYQLEVKTPESGVIVGWDAMKLADFVNNRLNEYIQTPASEIQGAHKGGVELCVTKDLFVPTGATLVKIYSDRPIDRNWGNFVLGIFDIRALD
jgi:thymidine phosphorylase